MAVTKITYANSAAITITLNSLAHSATAGRESTAIDNSTNVYDDAFVTVICVTDATTIAADQAVYVYAYASEDGTNYTDNATGTDAGITLRSPTNLVLLGVIATPTASATYKKTFTVAPAFGGILPRKWGIVVRPYAAASSGLASSGNSASYTGITYTTV